jgi:hypothetical protein
MSWNGGMTHETLDDAYDRFRQTGPEFDGWLSNHGPMAAESMVRHGHGDAVPTWVDRYSLRLEPTPTGTRMITDWRASLGRPELLGSWLAYFDDQLDDRAWTDVLDVWWPRLLPGIAAGATHGVIRVGHAVRALREGGESDPRRRELAQALGYWAARWQSVPAASVPAGALDARRALDAVPHVPQQTGGIVSRLAQLETVEGWREAQSALRPATDWEDLLRGVVTAAVQRYATHAHAEPVMLVHAATAPNAVLRTLPSLRRELWATSAAAAWTASAAVHAAYASPIGRPRPPAAHGVDDAFARAVDHGDEHVIKLADTALDVHAWHPDAGALAAIDTAVALVDAEQ